MMMGMPSHSPTRVYGGTKERDVNGLTIYFTHPPTPNCLLNFLLLPFFPSYFFFNIFFSFWLVIAVKLVKPSKSWPPRLIISVTLMTALDYSSLTLHLSLLYVS